MSDLFGMAALLGGGFCPGAPGPISGAGMVPPIESLDQKKLVVALARALSPAEHSQENYTTAAVLLGEFSEPF